MNIKGYFIIGSAARGVSCKRCRRVMLVGSGTSYEPYVCLLIGWSVACHIISEEVRREVTFPTLLLFVIYRIINIFVGSIRDSTYFLGRLAPLAIRPLYQPLK